MAKEIDVKQFSSDKILKHLDRVSEWYQGGNPPPITVELDMTNVCNHRCPECVAGYFQVVNRDSLSRELATSIIEQLGEAGARGLIFTGGGDPLCNKHTLDMIKLAKKVGMSVALITNGTLLNEKATEVILKNCVWVRVSMDAATPDLYKKTHGMTPKGFQKMLDNVRRMTSLKKKTKSGCTVGVGFLTNDDTKDEMVQATHLARELGVDYIQFRPMQIHRGGEFDYHWTEVDDIIYECRKLARPGFDVLFSKHKYDMMKTKDYGRNYKKCYGHQFATTICADGKMYLCCHLRGYEKYCFGDLKKQTFKEIWNSERRKKVYNSINFKDCIPLCRDNTFNQVLWNIKQPREHEDFL